MSKPVMNEAPFGLDQEFEKKFYWMTEEDLSSNILILSFNQDEFEDECIVHESEESLNVAILTWRAIHKSSRPISIVRIPRDVIDTVARECGIKHCLVLDFNFETNVFDLHDWWTIR